MVAEIGALLDEVVSTLLNYLPKIIGACAILALGLVLGKLIGRGFSSLTKRAGLEEAFSETLLGRALRRSNISLSSIIGTLARWFIYLVAIMLASEVVGAEVFSSLIRGFIEYLPYLIAGFLALIFGFIVADFLGNAVSAVGEEVGIGFSRIFGTAVKFFLYFIVAVTALSVMKVDVTILYVFANAIAWGIAVGAAAGLGIALGWGFKDIVAKNAESFLKSLGTTLAKTEESAELKELRRKTKELEKELSSYKERVEAMERERELAVRELERPVADIDKRLAELIGSTGAISKIYGGYEIEIGDPKSFPWCSVVLTLQNNGFDVWFSKKGDKYVVFARPQSERA